MLLLYNMFCECVKYLTKVKGLSIDKVMYHQLQSKVSKCSRISEARDTSEKNKPVKIKGLELQQTESNICFICRFCDQILSLRSNRSCYYSLCMYAHKVLTSFSIIKIPKRPPQEIQIIQLHFEQKHWYRVCIFPTEIIFITTSFSHFCPQGLLVVMLHEFFWITQIRLCSIPELVSNN